jgi:hypothetical protein
MYTGCNGATYVYTCCITVRARICGKILFLALGTAKRDFLHREMEKGLLSKFS